MAGMKREKPAPTTAGARFRAMFEGGEIVDSEDDDGSGGGGAVEMEEIKAKKSIISLKAVADKLKKRLSRESGGSTKRHSRSSVGTTEEEAERRAELRRWRQKRIQEELSSEEVYDEDAKSLKEAQMGGLQVSKRGEGAAMLEMIPESQARVVDNK